MAASSSPTPDLTGRYLHQGDVVGYVVSPQRGTVVAVVDQEDIGLLETRLRDVHVRLADDPDHTQRAELTRLTPAGDFSLPSAALGTAGGGNTAVAPDDADGRRTLARVFRVELHARRAGREARRPRVRAFRSRQRARSRCVGLDECGSSS